MYDPAKTCAASPRKGFASTKKRQTQGAKRGSYIRAIKCWMKLQRHDEREENAECSTFNAQLRAIGICALTHIRIRNPAQLRFSFLFSTIQPLSALASRRETPDSKSLSRKGAKAQRRETPQGTGGLPD
jgi:hypothetical protein